VILKTTDGGLNWVRLTSSTTTRFYSICFIDGNTGYAAGSRGDMFRTADGGSTWTFQNTGTAYNINDLVFTGTNTGYAVGNWWEKGAILKTTTGGGYPVGITEKGGKPSSLKIYPNPSSGKITVEAKETASGATFSMMNANGQIVMTGKIIPPGIQLDIRNLPGGIYFIRLTNDKSVSLGKFVKQ